MEITVFTHGDSRLKSTWSGVPYYLTEALEKHDVKINRVDISIAFPLSLVIRAYNVMLRIVMRRWGGYLPFNTLERSRIVMRIQEKRVEVWAKKFPNADFNLMFDFSTQLPISKIQNVMLCDWTIDYVIRVQKHREPNSAECKCIRRQQQVMKMANKIITLFPYVHEYEKERLSNIYYIGNGINSKRYSEDEIKDRYCSNKILFIGGKHYKDGAVKLIEAVGEYNRTHDKPVELQIVGMTGDFLGLSDNHFVKCYGYLNKDNDADEKLYYQLLKSSKIFCNPNKDWAGAQSLMEACYWKLPAIVTPNDEILRIYGESPEFGEYCDSDPHEICLAIEKILLLNREEYERLGKQAFRCVRSDTWDAYAERLIALLNNSEVLE